MLYNTKMLFIFPQNFVWVGAIIKKSYKNIGVQSYLQLTLHRGTQTLMNNITPKINVKGTDMKCASLRENQNLGMKPKQDLAHT